jgi:hypothetical protein
VEQQAAAEVTRRKVRRVAGLLRDVDRELAQLAGDTDVFGVHRVHDQESLEAASELVSLGVGRYGSVDVVVIPRATRRDNTPTTAPSGAKENSHVTSGQEKATGPGGRR